MITFAPFRRWFETHHPTRKRMDFQKETGLSPKTAAKIWKDWEVSTGTIEKICRTYNLQIHDVLEYIPDHKKTDVRETNTREP